MAIATTTMAPAGALVPETLDHPPQQAPFSEDILSDDPTPALGDTLHLAQTLSEEAALHLDLPWPEPVPPNDHEKPSQALKQLVHHLDTDLSPDQQGQLDTLDTLDAELAEPLTEFIDAFLALTVATTPGHNAPPPTPSSTAPPPAAPAHAPLEGPSSLLPLTLSTRNQFLDTIVRLHEASGTAKAEALDQCAPIQAPPAVSIDLSSCDNHYTEDYALLLDMGGSDVYHNNAGGGSLSAGAAIDFGPGNDTFGAPNNPRSGGVNGGGAFGSGILITEMGDNTYNGGSEGINGGAYFGTGLLIDGRGDDAYNAQRLGVNGGLSAVGSGLLLDAGGDDTYVATTLGVNGEGDAGPALLLDLGGTDTYQERGSECTDCSTVPKGTAGAQVDEDLEELGPDTLDLVRGTASTMREQALDAAPSFHPAGCVPRSAIDIQGDDALRDPLGGVLNPTAEGTHDDPYVITGWCAPSILIQDTSSHVLVLWNTIGPSDNGLHLDQATNVTVRSNLITDNIDGVRIEVNHEHPNIRLIGNDIRGNDGWGMDVRQPSTLTVRDNTIEDNGGGGLSLSTGSYALKNNTIQNNNGWGLASDQVRDLNVVNNTIEANADGILLHQHPEATAEKSTIESNTIDDNGRWGIKGLQASNLPINNNLVTNNEEAGILLEGGAYILEDNTIEDNDGWGIQAVQANDAFIKTNHVNNNAKGGILLEGGAYILEFNTIQNNNGWGIQAVQANDAFIKTNHVNNNAKGGILLDGDAYTLKSNTLKTNNGWALRVRGSGHEILDNRVEENQRGIRLLPSGGESPKNVTIDGNTVLETQRWALWIEGSHHKVRDNTIRFSAISVFPTNGGGIRLDDGMNNSVRSNLLQDNGVWNPGVWIHRSSSSNTIEKNTIKDHRWHAIQVDGGPNTIQKNTFRDNTGRAILITGGSNIDVVKNSFADNNKGVVGSGGSALIKENLFDDDRYGIELLTNGFEVQENTFTETTWALMLRGAGYDTKIVDNSFEDGHRSALQVDNLSGTVDVTDNWWGDDTGPNSEDGAIVDACTGTTADGDGEYIRHTGSTPDPEDSPVCFDPWLMQPP